MAQQLSNYGRAVVCQLSLLARPDDSECDYQAAYEEFTYLWEDLEQAYSQGQVTAQQRDLIDAVLDRIDEISYREDRFRLGSNEALKSAPEWEPMREAAREALNSLRNTPE